MGKFCTITGSTTLQAMPINEHTEEGLFTDKAALNIDTFRVLADGAITFQMRSGASISIDAKTGEDFVLSEDVISFTTSNLVRLG